MTTRKKKRRAWQSADVREMKDMARKRVSAGKIAKKLGRTQGATRQKAFAIGLSLDSRRPVRHPRADGGTTMRAAA